MRKSFLRTGGDHMTAVAEAQTWAKHLVHQESRGPGDTENAMHRLESRFGIPWRTFWALKYRPPASICSGIRDRLRYAYFHECERGAERLLEKARIAKLTHTDPDLVDKAQALVTELQGLIEETADEAFMAATMKNRTEAAE